MLTEVSHCLFALSGHAYERRFITQWLRTKNTSPITNAELANQTLTPAHALRNAIQEWEMQYFKIIARPNLTPPSFDQETLISRGSFKEVSVHLFSSASFDIVSGE